jgi:Holliday junction resolvase
MASTPEKKVKDRLRKHLDRLGVYHFMPPANGFGRAGIPDIVGCMNGQFVAFECKAGKGKTTALQEREIAAIQAHKGWAFVINEDNVDNIEELLKLEKTKCETR